MNTKQTRPKRVKAYSSLLSWRQAKGFDQRQAATFLGISQAYYSKLERREQAPRPKMARQLTDRSGVPLDEILGIAS